MSIEFMRVGKLYMCISPIRLYASSKSLYASSKSLDLFGVVMNKDDIFTLLSVEGNSWFTISVLYKGKVYGRSDLGSTFKHYYKEVS